MGFLRLGRRAPPASDSGHNGGLSQIGVNFLQIGNDFVFMNAFKGAQSWTYGDNTGHPTPDELDANGYPVAGANCFSHSGVYTVFFVPTQTERPGNYVITWDGNGTIFCGMNNTLVIGSKTSSSGSGRYQFSTTDYRFSVGISSVGSPKITNLKVFHIDDETAITEGEIFGTKAVERMAEANFGVVRTGDWAPMNNTNQTTWATRKPVDYAFYGGQEYRATLYGGVTTNSGDDFSCSAPSAWAGLVDKTTVHVKWNASSSGSSPTLNVDGTGAIAIKDQYGNSLITERRPSSGKIATLVYDQKLNVWIKFGGDVDQQNQGLQNGVPPEMHLAFAIKCRAHWYVTSPYLALSNPPTDYMPSLIQYTKDNAPSWMIPRFEIVNELWNNSAAFYGTRYSWNIAKAFWPSVGDFGQNEWAGYQGSVLGQIASHIYGDDRSKYRVLVGCQTVPGPSGVNQRLEADDYVASGPAPANLVGSWGTIVFAQDPASDWATHIAIAQYVNPADYFRLSELIDGFNYAVTNAGNPTAQDALADAYAAGVGEAYPGAPGYTNAYLSTKYGEWFTWANSYGLGVTGYEGGYSPDYLGTNWTSPITGATAANPVVLTLATTANPAFGSLSGNAAVNGMSLSIASVGGMTQLNGNTYTVVGVGVADGLSANQVAIDVNGIGFSAFTSGGTATYVNSGLYTNTLRYASKFYTGLKDLTLDNYNNFTSAGGDFPSHFFFSGTSGNPNDRASTIGTGQAWGAWDPSIYGEEAGYWQAFVEFNN